MEPTGEVRNGEMCDAHQVRHIAYLHTDKLTPVGPVCVAQKNQEKDHVLWKSPALAPPDSRLRSECIAH